MRGKHCGESPDTTRLRQRPDRHQQNLRQLFRFATGPHDTRVFRRNSPPFSCGANNAQAQTGARACGTAACIDLRPRHAGQLPKTPAIAVRYSSSRGDRTPPKNSPPPPPKPTTPNPPGRSDEVADDLMWRR